MNWKRKRRNKSSVQICGSSDGAIGLSRKLISGWIRKCLVRRDELLMIVTVMMKIFRWLRTKGMWYCCSFFYRVINLMKPSVVKVRNKTLLFYFMWWYKGEKWLNVGNNMEACICQKKTWLIDWDMRLLERSKNWNI